MNTSAVNTMRDGAGKLVSTQKAADAVKWFATLWLLGAFDCEPQDYEFMVKESLVERCLIFGS
jgi:hypothetical protein